MSKQTIYRQAQSSELQVSMQNKHLTFLQQNFWCGEASVNASVNAKQALDIFTVKLMVWRGKPGAASDLKSADSRSNQLCRPLKSASLNPPIEISSKWKARSVKVLSCGKFSDPQVQRSGSFVLIDVKSISLSIPISAPDSNKIILRLTYS